jgi:hypothetical protein
VLVRFVVLRFRTTPDGVFHHHDRTVNDQAEIERLNSLDFPTHCIVASGSRRKA